MGWFIFHHRHAFVQGRGPFCGLDRGVSLGIRGSKQVGKIGTEMGGLVEVCVSVSVREGGWVLRL